MMKCPRCKSPVYQSTICLDDGTYGDFRSCDKCGWYVDLILGRGDYTCEYCPSANDGSCPYAWDEYNKNGDCLGIK
jgi:hypothetical protein